MNVETYEPHTVLMGQPRIEEQTADKDDGYQPVDGELQIPPADWTATAPLRICPPRCLLTEGHCPQLGVLAP